MGITRLPNMSAAALVVMARYVVRLLTARPTICLMVFRSDRLIWSVIVTPSRVMGRLLVVRL